MEEKSYAERVKELLNLPQSLCKQCGQCCDTVIYKNGLSYDKIIELINNPETDPSQRKGAKDFLSIFELITLDEAQQRNYKFTIDISKKLNIPLEEISFFHCKYLSADRKCSIHDKRPDLCKHYPVCYKDMFYFDGCGYAEQAKKNWAEIEKIINQLS